MSAFNDVRCKCGRKIGWVGKPSDRPPCPSCHDRPSEAELKKADASLERDIALLEASISLRPEKPKTEKQKPAWVKDHKLPPKTRAQAMHDLTLVQARRIVSDLDGIDPQKVADVLNNECLTEDKKVERIADLLARG